jgi:hypothetical protein
VPGWLFEMPSGGGTADGSHPWWQGEQIGRVMAWQRRKGAWKKSASAAELERYTQQAQKRRRQAVDPINHGWGQGEEARRPRRQAGTSYLPGKASP